MNDIDAILDSLYDDVDEALLAGRFAEVDEKIRALDVAALPVEMLLGWLTITHAAAERLPARGGFAVAVARRLEAEDGIDGARDLLRGLIPEACIPVMRIDWPNPPPDSNALPWRAAAFMTGRRQT